MTTSPHLSGQAAQTLCSPSAAQTRRAKQRMLISLLNFIFTTQKLSLIIFYFLLFVLAGSEISLL